MIELEKVSKEYRFEGGSFWALKDVSLVIQKGDFISIVGPSGCGKSTLMHMIGLLDNPTSGTIRINSKDTSVFSDRELSGLRGRFIGFIFQQFNLINKMTVMENVLLPAVYLNSAQKDAKKRAVKLLERFGIVEKAGSYPNKLSGGQQQRVAIARALINNPQLILADEPTGNLDSESGRNILSVLTKLNREENITVCIVTHDRVIARKAQRIISMKDGRVIS